MIPDHAKTSIIHDMQLAWERCHNPEATHVSIPPYQHRELMDNFIEQMTKLGLAIVKPTSQENEGIDTLLDLQLPSYTAIIKVRSSHEPQEYFVRRDRSLIPKEPEATPHIKHVAIKEVGVGLAEILYGLRKVGE